MSQRFQTALRAARTAGKIVRAKLDDPRAIKSKGKRDIVTDADFAADCAVRKMLRERLPRDYFLSEEDSLVTRRQLWARAEEFGDESLWVVDPLDGTTNYAHRLPAFCVSIALY